MEERKERTAAAWQSAKLSLEFIEIHDGCEDGGQRRQEREREDKFGRDSSQRVDDACGKMGEEETSLRVFQRGLEN